MANGKERYNIEKPRVEWVDIAKGIGILLVVFAHTLFNFRDSLITGSTIQSTIRMIYLFHMPLFIFISGFLFNKNGNILRFIGNQCKSLIIPYISFFVLVVTLLLLTKQVDKVSVMDFAKYMWSGKYLVSDIVHLQLAAMWYLLCLFNTRILYNCLVVWFGRSTVFTIISACLLLAYANSVYRPALNLPFCINLTVFAVFVFYLGDLYKKYATQSAQWGIIILGIPAVLSPLLFGVRSINIIITNYGTPFVSLVCSIIGVLFIINISKLLEETKYVNRILTELGKASLVIMALHLALYRIISVPVFGNNPFWATITEAMTGHIVYLFFNRYRITQIVFLGKWTHNKQITNPLNI